VACVTGAMGVASRNRLGLVFGFHRESTRTFQDRT